MTEHSGLPVAGYKPQSAEKVALVNENKVLEEQVLRQIEKIKDAGVYDGRMASIAFTGIQEAFMWLNRAVFRPGRIELPPPDKSS